MSDRFLELVIIPGLSDRFLELVIIPGLSDRFLELVIIPGLSDCFLNDDFINVDPSLWLFVPYSDVHNRTKVLVCSHENIGGAASS